MAQVELILGPAGAGKTARVRAAFRAELAGSHAAGRFGTTLWITPTQRSRRQVLRSLLSGKLGVCFTPRVVTFDEFAEGLLRSAPAAIRPLSRIAKRKLLRDLIDDLHRRRKLAHFGAVADTAGFLDLCVSFIAELKREEIWPEDFDTVCRQASDAEEGRPGRHRGNPRDRELVAIYDAYQRRLHAADGKGKRGDVTWGLYDGEGRFWSARTLMQQGHRGPFRDLSLVVVDGFTDFTRTQYEMLGVLAGWTDRMLVTLPLDAAARREELFTKSAAALAELTAAFEGHAVSEVRLDLPAEAKQSTFGHVASRLFDNPRETPKSPVRDGITILSCVRPAGEIETVAKRIKRMLVDGTPADDVVVAFRTLDGAADLIRERFEAAGVPAVVEVGPAIARTGAVRFLLSLIELEREDWTFSRLTGVLNSALFRPDRPGVSDGAAARAVAATLRAMNLDGGREAMLAALARRAERQEEARGVRETASGEQTAVALDALRRLSEALAPLRERATFAEWVDRLLSVASALGLAPDEEDRITGDDGSLARAEAGGWQAFVRLVEEAKKAETLAGGGGAGETGEENGGRGVAGGRARMLGLGEFRRQLLELLAGQTWETDGVEEGMVRILPAEQVRNLDVPHLFLCGLSESVFPQSRGEDCLYGDAERHRLNEQGVPLGHRARRSREEMLLFYGVVTRARQSLTLSYPSVSDGGEPLYPSPYLTVVRDLFEEHALPVESCGALDPVPARSEECVTEAELRVAATWEALAGRGGLFAALAERRESNEAALNVAAAAEMAAARFATRGLTGYEGMLTDPRNVKRLRQRFGGRHEFSATELETYAAHPFRFFLKIVLGLEPTGDPGPGTDYARRGQAMHAALAALHRKLTDEAAEAIVAESLGGLLRAEVEAALAVGGDTPLQRALRRIEREILSKRADRYGSQWEKYLVSMCKHWDGSPRPAHFEVPFGNPREEEGDEAGPRHPTVEFGNDGARVRVCGRIDRIDIGTADGRAVYNVIDYKLAQSPPTFLADDLEVGRALQLVIYAIAARRLGLVEAELFQLGFWSINGDGFVCGLKTGKRTLVPLDAETAALLEETLDRVVPMLVDSIRAGRFPVVADDPEEPYNADYAAVARVGSFRAVAEVLEKRVSLDST